MYIGTLNLYRFIFLIKNWLEIQVECRKTCFLVSFKKFRLLENFSPLFLALSLSWIEIYWINWIKKIYIFRIFNSKLIPVFEKNIVFRVSCTKHTYWISFINSVTCLTKFCLKKKEKAIFWYFSSICCDRSPIHSYWFPVKVDKETEYPTNSAKYALNNNYFRKYQCWWYDIINWK